MNKSGHESVVAAAVQSASVVKPSSNVDEQMQAHGRYKFQHLRVYSDRLDQFIALREQAELIHKKSTSNILSRIKLAFQLGFKKTDEVLAEITAKMESMQYVLDEGEFDNLVTTVGKNYLLDNGMAGSGFTAAYYMGLISSTSYSAIAAGDTMASHSGWLEAGVANAPTYSQSARPTTAWSAASAGSKSLSSALSFSITGTGTVKGCFLNTVATKDGTTGTLFSAGLFSAGDRAVINGDTLNVSYSVSL